MSTEAMTTSEYDDLVKTLRYFCLCAVSNEKPCRECKAADAITRLLREKSELANTAHLRFKEIVDLGVKVASARAQGAEEMREAAAKYHEHRARMCTIHSETQRQRGEHKLAASTHDLRLNHEASANEIRALPLPSPVAARAVPEALEAVARALCVQAGEDRRKRMHREATPRIPS